MSHLQPLCQKNNFKFMHGDFPLSESMVLYLVVTTVKWLIVTWYCGLIISHSAGILGERGLGLVVHFPSGCVAKIIPRDRDRYCVWPCCCFSFFHSYPLKKPLFSSNSLSLRLSISYTHAHCTHTCLFQFWPSQWAWSQRHACHVSFILYMPLQPILSLFSWLHKARFHRVELWLERRRPKNQCLINAMCSAFSKTSSKS